MVWVQSDVYHVHGVSLQKYLLRFEEVWEIKMFTIETCIIDNQNCQKMGKSRLYFNENKLNLHWF